MTKSGTSYNYSFPFTALTGEYVYKTYGESVSEGVCTQNVKFTITPTGDQRGFSLLLILALAAAMIFVFGWYTKNVWFVYIAGTVFLVLGVYTMIYGFNNINDLYTQTIAIISILIGVLFTIGAIYEQVWGGEILEE